MISANFLRAFGNAAAEKDFRVYESSLMIEVEDMDSVLYADGSVFCDPLDQNPIHRNLVRNPNLILEVGSSRFFQFQMLGSLTTYIYVEEQEPIVHLASKNGSGNWSVTDYFGLEAFVDIKPFGVSIAMAQIYEWIDFK